MKFKPGDRVRFLGDDRFLHDIHFGTVISTYKKWSEIVDDNNLVSIKSNDDIFLVTDPNDLIKDML